MFLGTLAGVTSPARTYSPALAAQLDLPAGARFDLPVDPAFEHAVLVDRGEVTVADVAVPAAWLGYLAPGRRRLPLRVGHHPARVVVIGGTPFAEQILMWWNFVGRTHDEVVAARAEWQRVVAASDGAGAAVPAAHHEQTRAAIARFGAVPGYDGRPLPAPDLPNVRLRPRERPPG